MISPLVGRAEHARRIPRVGVLWHAGSPEEEAIYLAALRAGFNDLGYVEGKTVTLENRFAAEQYERFQSLAAELVALKVDVLVAVTRPAAVAAQRETATIPVVFISVPDPIGSKLVHTLAKPGGNVTGLSNMAADLNAKRLELFKEAVPGLSRVALLVNPSDPEVTRQTVEALRAGAAPLNLSVQPFEVREPGELDRVFSAITRDPASGVTIQVDPMLFNERGQIAELALARGLPTMSFNADMAAAGCLMSYGPNYPAMFRRAAVYVDRILKGAKPADLPIEQPTQFEFVINLKTAKALGVTIPPSMLMRADKVIE